LTKTGTYFAKKNETKMALSKRKYARANLLGRCVAEQRKC
jgi:hypothetical protein